MATNLVSMGVTNASASDGLTTLCGKILNIAPSVGGITPTVSIDIDKTPSTVSVGNNVLISAKVNADYDDTSQVDIDLKGVLQGATVTFKNNNTVLGTSVTGSDGIATYTISNIASGSYSITAHFDGTGTDYESATSSALTFTPISALIDDDCSVDDSSNLFGAYISLRNSGTATATYNSSVPCYEIKNTKGSAEAFIPFKPLEGVTDSFKITFLSKTTTSTVCPIGLFYYINSRNWGGVKDESTNMWFATKTNGSYSESNKGGNNNKTDVIKTVITFNATAKTLKIDRYNETGTTLINTQTMNIPSAITIDSSVKWGTSVTWDNNTIREIYNIQAEYI